ncbi:hypothetical protein J6Q66_04560 [bacterium]|nr:hypothetical protein [bacterium]
MRFFEKVKINLKNGKSRIIKIFGVPILQYYRSNNNDGAKIYSCPLFNKERNDGKPIFYLKINRTDDYAFVCLQHWIDIIAKMDREFIILCDKPELEKKVLEKVFFNSQNVNFMKSMKNGHIEKIVNTISTKFWIKATLAHLTTFYHAKKSGFNSFWNIDADDTLFCMDPCMIGPYLKNIEQYAEENKISAFSLDMHRSRTNGIHWSFGITYTRMDINWFSIFKENKNSEWQKYYNKYDYEFNLDWFFTYLRDYKNIKNETFYINNSSFIHWGNFILNVIGSGVFEWRDGRLKFPIILGLLKNSYFGDIPIAKDCVKFESELTKEYSINFITDKLTYLYKPSKQMDNMWVYDGTSNNKNEIEKAEYINSEASTLKEQIIEQKYLRQELSNLLVDIHLKFANMEAPNEFNPVALFNKPIKPLNIEFLDSNISYIDYLFPNLKGTFKNNQATELHPNFFYMTGIAGNEEHLRTISLAHKQNEKVYIIEDAFLRSIFSYVYINQKPEKYYKSIGFTIDDITHYIDCSRASRLERWLNDKDLIITDEQKQRARKCIDKILETHLSKYNNQPIFEPKIGREGAKKILVVDQSYGDWSITKGGGSEEVFKNMLQKAIDENPDADIIVKTHPDTMSGNRGGYYTGLKQHDNIYPMTEPINPISLVKYCDKVYVCTTQLGFEALMCGKEVHVFGIPFYQGWGLTIDEQKCERRTNKRTLEEVFYIAYIMYSHYVNPNKKCRCEIEEAMDYLLKLRDEYFKERGQI